MIGGTLGVPASSEPGSLEVSVVIPCLNEAETLGTCIEKAARSMREQGIKGEIVVADNGGALRGVEAEVAERCLVGLHRRVAEDRLRFLERGW